MKSIKSKIFALAVLLIIGLVVTYSNHFQNEFHFDDSHTIQSNQYITSLHNIPLFFRDIRTFSSKPTHWGYRPMVTTTLAIDYWLGGGLKPFYFHLSTFLWYIVLCILLYVIYKKIIDKSITHKWTGYFALFSASLYALHTANAETINYIISRSDVLSTLCIVASLTIFISYPKLRKYYIYVLPALIGITIKETIIVLPVIIFFYLLYFEKKLSLFDIFKKDKFVIALKTFIYLLPVIAIIALAQIYAISKLSSTENISTPFLPYFSTQSFVWLHYVIMFFLPMGLSADTDLGAISNLFDDRIIIGLIFIILLFVAIFKTSKKQEYRPISFGLIWFAAALFPTSVIPLSEVMNDHRMFFPFIGLTFSVVYSVGLVLIKFEKNILAEKKYQVLIWITIFLILSGYACGTYQRNKVWRNEETLWLDVTQKSPQNGRGLMNYGLTQMWKSNYNNALSYFDKALIYCPYYSYLYINLGILKNIMGKPVEAEEYFKKGILYGPTYQESYYYYANFLKQQKRLDEAMNMAEKSTQINPDYMLGLYLLMDIYLELENWDKLNAVVERALSIVPNDPTALKYGKEAKNKISKIEDSRLFAEKNKSPENYLSLSLLYYQKGLYEKCIEACNEALKLNPNFADAYNNICSAYNALGKYSEGIKACEKALKIKPDLEIAKNNLNWAKLQLKK